MLYFKLDMLSSCKIRHVSSAYSRGAELVELLMSLIYIVKSRGPRTEPFIACDLQFASPLQFKILATPMQLTMSNVHSRHRSLHLCNVTHAFTSGCLQHCRGAKYMLHCFQPKTFLVWKYEMEYGGKILVWNGRFLLWNGNGMEENCQNGIWKNHLPYHTIPCPVRKIIF